MQPVGQVLTRDQWRREAEWKMCGAGGGAWKWGSRPTLITTEKPSPFRIRALTAALCLFLELGLPPFVRLVPVNPDLGKREFETRCESKVADQLGGIYVDLKRSNTRTVIQQFQPESLHTQCSNGHESRTANINQSWVFDLLLKSDLCTMTWHSVWFIYGTRYEGKQIWENLKLVWYRCK